MTSFHRMLENVSAECPGLVCRIFAVSKDCQVTGVVSDASALKGGEVFVAIRGFRSDGNHFVGEALRRGASVIVTDLEEASPEGSFVLVSNARRAYSYLLKAFYGWRNQDLPRLVGVTGTNGKTSVVRYLFQMLMRAGCSALLTGSLGVDCTQPKDLLVECDAGFNLNNTPDAGSLYKLLSAASARRIEYACIEASSQGMDQSRLDGLKFTAAGFTNLSADHLEYHGGMASYFQAKKRLFTDLLAQSGAAVLNVDDPFGQKLRSLCLDRGHTVVTYGRCQSADVQIQAYRHLGGRGLEVVLDVLGCKISTLLRSVTLFDVYNVCCAIGLFVALGHPFVAELVRDLPSIPGRMEVVTSSKVSAPIVIDYAHTPDALEKALQAVRFLASEKVILVFGCGGDRDQGKRSVMGALAQEFADLVIVTDDNPRREDPALIRRAILEGCPKALEIGDRRQAIRYALSQLSGNDVLLIAGKGCEEYQASEPRGGGEPLSDLRVVQSIIAPLR